MGNSSVQVTETRYYRICGLTVAAGLDLPGAASVEGPVDAPDAFISHRAVPESLPDATRRGPTWEFASGQVLLHVPGVARFLMKEGREVLIEPAAGRTDSELAIFVMGSAMGALLHQRGYFVLHASAVSVDGGAVIFCGSSGAGKSSLAAALSAKGYPLVTDDVCRIQFDGGRPMVIPDGRRLKLWADAVTRLSLQERRRTAVRPGIEKYWVDSPTPPCLEPVPLRAIYFLRAANSAQSRGITAANLVDAAEFLRANAYRPRLVGAFGQEQLWLESCVTIMRQVRAWHLWRTLQYDQLPDCLDMLEEHWRG